MQNSALKPKIITGDCLEVLPTLPVESVQCCVTSPPYWGLRDYNHPRQIGSEASPVAYIEKLVETFREVRRVLRKDGTFWLNIGDGYARNGGTGNCGPNAIVGNTKKLIQKRNCKVPNCWGLKDRDLMGIPWRVAFALQSDGWVLRLRITWIKKSAMPESVKNRPTTATEDIFLFTKSAKYYYDSEAVKEPTGANLRNYWILGPEPNTRGHPAAFPMELARRCIKLGTREGDIVLDPFGGCGTTGLAAEELKRQSVLIELNPVYVEMSRKWSKYGKKTRVKELILEYFLDNIGKVVESRDIQAASGGAVEWARRVRELRNEMGYQILSHKDRADLKPNQYLLETDKRVPAFKREISKETRAYVLERNGYTCQMCGLAAGDTDPYNTARTVRLTMGHIKDKLKGGDDSPQNLRAVCTNCNEGLQNAAPPKPDRILLLAQVQRATIDDQKALFDWLAKKYGYEIKKI